VRSGVIELILFSLSTGVVTRFASKHRIGLPKVTNETAPLVNSWGGVKAGVEFYLVSRYRLGF